jgi:hypothetical protein
MSNLDMLAARSKVQTAAFSVAGTTSDVVAAPGAGNRIIVLGVFSMPNATGTEQWLSAATALTGTMSCGVSAPKSFDCFWQCGDNEALRLAAGTATISGFVTYMIC